MVLLNFTFCKTGVVKNLKFDMIFNTTQISAFCQISCFARPGWSKILNLSKWPWWKSKVIRDQMGKPCAMATIFGPNRSADASWEWWWPTYSMEMHSLTSSFFIICLWGETFGSRTILLNFMFCKTGVVKNLKFEQEIQCDSNFLILSNFMSCRTGWS